MKIALSGGSGFLGLALKKELKGKQYIEYSRRVGSQENLHRQLDYRVKIPDDIGTDIDTYLHLAWGNVKDVNHEDHFSEAEAIYKLIRKMVLNGVTNVIVMGSCFEYGKKYGPVKPDADVSPITRYGIAKDYLHNKLKVLKKDQDFNLAWIRGFYIFDFDARDKTVVGLLNKAIDIGDSCFDMSKGEQLLDYIEVSDAAKRIANFIYRKDINGSFNLGTGKPRSLFDLLCEVKEKRNSSIKLNRGVYSYRDYESLAIWSDDCGNI